MKDLFEFEFGIPFDSAVRTPSLEETENRAWVETASKYKPRILGHSQKGEVIISEEQRPHIHLIGTTQEGKSKLIEHLIRDDIKRGIGLCLLDPTAGAKTVKDVFRYCCYKKLEKVCLIDPYHRHQFGKVPALSPFLYTSDGKRSTMLRDTCIKDFEDTVQILFNTEDKADTPRVNRYLPSVLKALYDAQKPLWDVLYFTNRLYVDQREVILAHTDPITRLDVQEAFLNPPIYLNFQSTVNRMKRFFDGTLGLMFKPQTGLNFTKLVAEGWVILVNLDTGLGFDSLDSRLLGTHIINSIQTAIDRLNKKHPNSPPKPFYLYIDEAGDYANAKLAETLEKKQKTGLKITIAHQHLKQFKDPSIRNAVVGMTKITAMFDILEPTDRDYLMKKFNYGGDITPVMASVANANLKKQYCVMKVLKANPERVRIPDVEEPPVTEEQLIEYTNHLYLQPHYYSAYQLEEQIRDDEREFQPQTQATNTPPLRKRTSPDGKTNINTPKAGRKSLLDLEEDAEKFIRNNAATKGDGKQEGTTS